MLVPMVLALHDAETHDRIVYLAKRLIVPFGGARLHKAWDVDKVERVEFDVEMHSIREGGSIGCRHRFLLLKRNKEAEKCYRLLPSSTDSTGKPVARYLRFSAIHG